jgi:flagellar hook-length control protein FliK
MSRSVSAIIPTSTTISTKGVSSSPGTDTQNSTDDSNHHFNTALKQQEKENTDISKDQNSIQTLIEKSKEKEEKKNIDQVDPSALNTLFSLPIHPTDQIILSGKTIDIRFGNMTASSESVLTSTPSIALPIEALPNTESVTSEPLLPFSPSMMNVNNELLSSPGNENKIHNAASLSLLDINKENPLEQVTTDQKNPLANQDPLPLIDTTQSNDEHSSSLSNSLGKVETAESVIAEMIQKQISTGTKSVITEVSAESDKEGDITASTQLSDTDVSRLSTHRESLLTADTETLNLVDKEPLNFSELPKNKTNPYEILMDSGNQFTMDSSSMTQRIQPNTDQIASKENNNFSVNIPMTHEEWMQQVAEKMIIGSSKKMQSIEIHLHPTELGSLKTEIKFSDDKTDIIISSPLNHVRESLEANLPKLREMFGDSNVNLGSVSISNSTEHKERSQTDQMPHQQNKSSDHYGKENVSSEETSDSEQISNSTNSIGIHYYA